ncbi:hypothetical protein CYMTET_2909 [Cymbomonas tetramitiformis]|uniref:Uncharacterized protein n=1 Tax=Cymbomonas tetramitiformis TaxID=36881 RepID=A0AAE0LLX4_9CHLO|nr:hypothetical protein CYMTET_2909 [Cymbomonas tetramitiformis]
MAITRNHPRRTAAPAESSHIPPGASPEGASQGLPTVHNMEPYSPSSKSESPRSSISDLWDDSKKSTSVSDEDEKMEEYSTPDTKLPEKEEEEIPQSDLRAKLNARKSHNSRGEQPQQKKVRFERPVEEKTKNTKKQQNQIGNAGTAGPRAGNPEGKSPSQAGQVPTKQIVEAVNRTLPNLWEVTNAPQGDIPPIGRVLHKIAKVLGGKQNPGDDQEEQIKDILGKWYKDRRAVVLAEDPASIELKLGLPVEEDGIHRSAHVRAITGCDLPLKDTSSVGLPLQGLPQVKLVDLDESVKEAIKYLRYLDALVREISEQPYVCQQEYALLLLFHAVFRLPLQALPKPHQTFSVKQKVIPCAFVWPPGNNPAVGPPSLRSLLVYGPGLGGKSIQDLPDTLATEVLVNEEGERRLGQLVDRIKKGSNRESLPDATLREVILLEAVSREAADHIVNNPYDWGTRTEVCWLPNKALGEEATKREVAVVDYDQQLFVDHRRHIVAAITSHVIKITSTTVKLCKTEDIFQLHVGTRQWPPSSYEDPASLLQWKRNGGTKTKNFYAGFTDEAYETLLVTGKQTVLVQAGVDDRRKHIEVPVVIEVGRWSEKGSRPTINRHPNHSGETDHLTRTAEEAIAKVEEKAASLIQQAATAAGGATPETKELLKAINKQLSRWCEAEPVTAEGLNRLHEKQEAKRTAATWSSNTMSAASTSRTPRQRGACATLSQL